MKKIPPNIKKAISRFNELLPKRAYAVADTCLVDGSDVILAGTERIKGKEVDPQKQYMMSIPRYHHIDHARRLQRVFRRKGKPGIYEYLKDFVKPEGLENLKKLIDSL